MNFGEVAECSFLEFVCFVDHVILSRPLENVVYLENAGFIDLNRELNVLICCRILFFPALGSCWISL